MAPLLARRGYDAAAPWESVAADERGVAVIRAEELERIELDLGEAGDFAGHQRLDGHLARLPVGSALNPATGTFTWQPGVGFVGTYELVFVRTSGGRVLARREVLAGEIQVLE